MQSSSQPVLAFDGPVEVRKDAGCPLGLALVGRASGENKELAQLAFVCAPPQDMPATLENVTVNRLEGNRFCIIGSGREWVIEAAGIHIHRDVSGVFFEAIPPHRAPLSKRVFWRVVLAIAGTPLGRALLARRSR